MVDRTSRRTRKSKDCGFRKNSIWFGKDHSGKNNPMFNRKHKPESNEKNRLSHLGKKKGPYKPRTTPMSRQARNNIGAASKAAWHRKRVVWFITMYIICSNF